MFSFVAIATLHGLPLPLGSFALAEHIFFRQSRTFEIATRPHVVSLHADATENRELWLGCGAELVDFELLFSPPVVPLFDVVLDLVDQAGDVGGAAADEDVVVD